MPMKMKDLAPEERPREKLASRGARALDNRELIAILLRTGTGKRNAVEIAGDLFAATGNSLGGLAESSIEEMTGVTGIGTDKAVTVAAAMELGKRFVYEEDNTRKVPVTEAMQIYRLMLPVLKGLVHEECWVVFLNRANYILGQEMVSSGGMSSTVLDVKMILRRALEKKAHGIILVHNHPSGNPYPGSSDIRQTENLKKAAETFDISLVDHIVIAGNRYYSFADEEARTV